MKDKILLGLVLALYIGALAFTGALTSIAETMWKQINTVASTLASPYGIFQLLAGICVLLYIVGLKTLNEILRRIKAVACWAVGKVVGA